MTERTSRQNAFLRLVTLAFWLGLLFHISCGIFLIHNDSPIGWGVSGVALFGIFLLFDPNASQNPQLLASFQALLLLQTSVSMYTLPTRDDSPTESIVETLRFHHPSTKHPNQQHHHPRTQAEAAYFKKKHKAMKQHQAELEEKPTDRALAQKVKATSQRSFSQKPQGPPPVDPEVPFGFQLDLLSVSDDQVKESYPRLFQDLGSFDEAYRNPCVQSSRGLLCLPYAYVLGMPKCGSSDLWVRLTTHPSVLRADRKEVRFFTRGEFAYDSPKEGFLGPNLRLEQFAKHHRQAAKHIEAGKEGIVVDGGPHTLWWSIQQPDGSQPPLHVPIPHILHALQPTAKFIITLADPLRRMYSDYHFLDETAVAFNSRMKSPEDFDRRVRGQVKQMQLCLLEFDPHAVLENDASFSLSLQAEQACAYDRYHFGRPGNGRLSVGMYHAFMQRWFKVFPRDQFLILRLEDYTADPRTYLQRAFTFLGVPSLQETDWAQVLKDTVYNAHRDPRSPMLPRSEQLLRSFYEPLNRRLAALLRDDRFLWTAGESPASVAVTEKQVLDTSSLAPFKVVSREELLAAPAERVTSEGGSTALCYAAFGLHKQAMERFLAMPGVSATAIDLRNANRTGLHCLGITYVYGDSLRGSFLFSLLKSRPSWLDAFTPSIARGGFTYSLRDVTSALDDRVGELAELLLASGADASAPDAHGRTPLHYAAWGGFSGMARALLKARAPLDVTDGVHGQTPLHFAVLYGQAAVAEMLVRAGADVAVEDGHGHSPLGLASSAGSAISAAELWAIFGVEKQPPRALPPPKSGVGGGGFNEHRLPAPYSSDRCDVDMLNANEITPSEVRERYLLQNRPVLLRGVLDGSPGWKAYSKIALLEKFGDQVVQVSDIPYFQKFGSTNGQRKPLREYIQNMGKGVDGSRLAPWYVFKGHKVPVASEATDSFVHPETMPIPLYMHSIFKPESPASNSQTDIRKPFVNMQFAFGQTGSGAPVHFHNTAWSALFYGEKHWYIFPPAKTLMGKRQVLDWVRNELPRLKARGFEPMECTQHSGDVMIIPELWGHAVLNTKESIAVASESKSALYRVKAVPRPFGDLSPLERSSHRRRPGAENTQ